MHCEIQCYPANKYIILQYQTPTQQSNPPILTINSNYHPINQPTLINIKIESQCPQLIIYQMDQTESERAGRQRVSHNRIDKYNLPKPQPSYHNEQPQQLTTSSNYQLSQNSVLRSQDILASFGPISANPIPRSKMNLQTQIANGSPSQFGQSKSRGSPFRSGSFLQELQRKYLPDRKPRDANVLRFLETLISIIKMRERKTQREVFLILYDKSGQARRIENQVSNVEIQAKRRLQRFEMVRNNFMETSEVKVVEEDRYDEHKNYRHNQTKIDSLMDPIFESEASEFEKPGLKQSDRFLEILGKDKPQQIISRPIIEQSKDYGFKFKQKIHKRHQDKNSGHNLNAALTNNRNPESYNFRNHQIQATEYKLPHWIQTTLIEQPLAESNPLFENYEQNIKLYHMNPDTLKQNSGDFHQPIQPLATHEKPFTSLQFDTIKHPLPLFDPHQEIVIGSTQNSLNNNASPLQKKKNFSFVNPYLKNIDAEEYDQAEVHGRLDEPEYFERQYEPPAEFSNSFHISDQNSIQSQRDKKKTFTRNQLPNSGEDYFNAYNFNKEKNTDRSIQYKMHPQDKVKLRPKSNTVGVRTNSFSVLPRNFPYREEGLHPHQLKPHTVNHIMHQNYKKTNDYGNLIQEQNSSIRPISQLNFQSQGNSNLPQGVASSKICNVQPLRPKILFVSPQDDNKWPRAVSSGHLSYCRKNQSPSKAGSPSGQPIRTQFFKKEPSPYAHQGPNFSKGEISQIKLDSYHEYTGFQMNRGIPHRRVPQSSEYFNCASGPGPSNLNVSKNFPIKIQTPHCISPPRHPQPIFYGSQLAKSPSPQLNSSPSAHYYNQGASSPKVQQQAGGFQGNRNRSREGGLERARSPQRGKKLQIYSKVEGRK